MSETTIRCEDCNAKPFVEQLSETDRVIVRCNCKLDTDGSKSAFDLDEMPQAWGVQTGTLAGVTPKARKDYVACVENGLTYSEQAKIRGVAHPTVMANVERAKEQLNDE
jgi:hypothetical protein